MTRVGSVFFFNETTLFIERFQRNLKCYLVVGYVLGLVDVVATHAVWLPTHHPYIGPRLLCLIMTNSPSQYLAHKNVTHAVRTFVALRHPCSPSTPCPLVLVIVVVVLVHLVPPHPSIVVVFPVPRPSTVVVVLVHPVLVQ